MRSRFLGACLALGVVVGCRSIENVRDRSATVGALMPAEAAQLETDGWRLYQHQPRDLQTVTRAATELERAARTLPDDYDAQWKAAQALAFLAENEPQPAARRDAAQRGLVLARRARELQPERVEGQYWYAIDVGLFADVDRAYGLTAVGEMETALKKAIELDERYDYAGPLRTLGILHLRTPPPPASIGSARKGLRYLQRAVAAFPDYPENYLYLAEALRETNKPDEARAALAKVLAAQPWPDRQFESAAWNRDAQKLAATLPAPK